MKKKLLAIVLTAVLVMSFTVTAFASGSTSTQGQVQYSDISSIFEQINKQFSVASMVALIAGVIGVSISFVFMWWAVRQLFKIVMAAIRKGRVTA